MKTLTPIITSLFTAMLSLPLSAATTPQFVVYQKSKEAKIQSLGLTPVHPLSADGKVFLAEKPQGASFVMARARSKDFIVEPNVTFHEIKPLQDDEGGHSSLGDLFGFQWNLKNDGQGGGKRGADIDFASLFSAPPVSNPDLKIAIVDSGIESRHSDLDTLHLAGQSFVDDENSEDSLTDQLGHGTHIAGIIGATQSNALGTMGIVNSLNVESLKIFDQSGASTLEKVIVGIQAAQAAGAKVVNLSLGSSEKSEILLEVMRDAGKNGILFVTAAGNDGASLETKPTYPAAFALENQIVVASTNNRDELSNFSNFSSTQVDIAAPGERILSTFLGGTFRTLSGTSMAAPHVTAAAALLLQREPQLSPQQVRARLVDRAVPLEALKSVIRSGARLSLTQLFGM